MADTRMYGNLGKDENRRLDNQNPAHGANRDGHHGKGWGRLKMPHSPSKSKEPHSPTIEKGTMAVTSAIIPVLQSDNIARIGLMKIKAVHMQTNYLGTERLCRPGSDHALSITRELAFGKKSDGNIPVEKLTWKEKVMARIPEDCVGMMAMRGCMGRMVLMVVVLALVCVVYVLKLKQNDLEKRLRGGGTLNTPIWADDVPVENTTLVT